MSSFVGLRAHVDEHFPGRVLLAEANQWPSDVRAYFGEGDEFTWPSTSRLCPPSSWRFAARIDAHHRDPRPDAPHPRELPVGPLPANHDELTLEMVTDADRDYMYLEYARDPLMRLNLRIRVVWGRSWTTVGVRSMLNSLLLSMPGAPFIYYGDEIGMGDNVYLGDRRGVRTPCSGPAIGTAASHAQTPRASSVR